MRSALLEITDQSLALISGGRLLDSEPCFAFFDQQWIFGESAKSVHRIKPRESQANYIAQLCTDPLPRPLGGLRHSADLAYMQIKALNDRNKESYDQIFLIPPSHYKSDQLSLLLGIVETAGLQIAGFIEPGLLDCFEQTSDSESVIFLDLNRQSIHAKVFRYEVQSQSFLLESSEKIMDRGMNQITDGLMQEAANHLIYADRFDPMRRAETEQQLFNGVLQLVQGDQDSSSIIPITHESGSRRVSISREMRERVVGNMVSTIQSYINAKDLPVICGPRFQHLTRLTTDLFDSTKIIKVGSELLAAQFTRIQDQLPKEKRDSGLWITQLKTRLQPSRLAQPALNPNTDAEVPSHLLFESHAVSFENLTAVWPQYFADINFRLTREVSIDMPSSQSLKINGTPLSAPSQINVGDEIELGTKTFIAIRVMR